MVTSGNNYVLSERGTCTVQAKKKQLGYRPSSRDIETILKELAARDSRSVNQTIDYAVKKLIEQEWAKPQQTAKGA